MPISKEEHDRRMEIYNRIYEKGGTCKDMAKEMFLTPVYVHKWIKKHNLPYDRKKGNRLSLHEQD